MTESATINASEMVESEAKPNRVRLRISLAVILVCVYTPYSWVLWIDYPWSDYRWLWIKMWPILPGVVPAVLLRVALQRFFKMDDALAVEGSLFVVAGVFAIALIAALIWLGMRSRRSLAAAVVLAVIVSVPCAFFAYALFRA